MSILHELVRRGNIERLRELLKSGENANAIDEREDTALHIVVSRKITNPEDTEGSVQMAGVLIEFGADMNKSDRRGRAPLLRAVIIEDRSMVEFLLGKKADIHVTDFSQNTALHLAIKETEDLGDFPVWDEYYAARKPILEMVETILRFNPDINARNNRDETPVLLAAKYQDFPVLKVLLQRDPFVHYGDSSNRSAMWYALARPSIHLDMVLELFRHRGEFYRRNEFEEYFPMLKMAPLAEMEKAKCLFRVFFLGDETLSPQHERMIEEISELKNFPLSRYIRDWRNEISQMKEDKLASKFSVYHMAQRGFFCKSEEKKKYFKHVFDALLDKLKNLEYPLYRDMIVSGISRSHLKYKFAEACATLRSTGREFLDYDSSFMVYPYLSNLDTLNFIIAFSV